VSTVKNSFPQLELNGEMVTWPENCLAEKAKYGDGKCHVMLKTVLNYSTTVFSRRIKPSKVTWPCVEIATVTIQFRGKVPVKNCLSDFKTFLCQSSSVKMGVTFEKKRVNDKMSRDLENCFETGLDFHFGKW